MDWIRENKPLAAILGVIIVGSLALGYLLFDAWSTYEETKEGYLGVGNQVAALEGARLAPTEVNLKAKQAVVEEYAQVVNRLGKTLLILQPQIAPIKDIEFQAKLKTKISEARQATQSKMQLPADFAFSFEEYTKNLPVSDAAATELSGYLDAMDELVKLFLKCNVHSLDELQRSKLAVEQAATAQQGGVQQPVAAAILEKRQISAVVTLDQGTLQLLVSRLATPSEMPFFTNLRLLRIENQRQDGPLRTEVRLPKTKALPAGGDTGTAGTPAKEQSDEIKPPEPAPVDTVPVFGQEALKVRLEIDLVKFLDGARGAAAPAPAPGR
jgi:hypothetical protein